MVKTELEAVGSSPNSDHRIASVRVLHCVQAEQHKEHRYGSNLPRLWWVFFGRSWVSLPLQAFLIEHRDGYVLFDTGIDPAMVSPALSHVPNADKETTFSTKSTGNAGQFAPRYGIGDNAAKRGNREITDLHLFGSIAFDPSVAHMRLMHSKSHRRAVVPGDATRRSAAIQQRQTQAVSAKGGPDP